MPRAVMPFSERWPWQATSSPPVPVTNSSSGALRQRETVWRWRRRESGSVRKRWQATIAEVVARARLINVDGNRLQRVTLKLFGSALEDRADYGDVDISITSHRRKLSGVEKQRIETALYSRQSEHQRQGVFSRLMGAERQDTRDIRATLKKGLPHLSLMRDDPMELGTPFKWLIDHDMEIDGPVEIRDSIIRPNAPAPYMQRAPTALPPATLIRARYRELSPKTKVPAEGLHIGTDDVARFDEAMWSPRMKVGGEFVANDRGKTPVSGLPGFSTSAPSGRNRSGAS